MSMIPSMDAVNSLLTRPMRDPNAANRISDALRESSNAQIQELRRIAEAAETRADVAREEAERAKREAESAKKEALFSRIISIISLVLSLLAIASSTTIGTLGLLR